jgi:hypothetical protein
MIIDTGVAHRRDLERRKRKLTKRSGDTTAQAQARAVCALVEGSGRVVGSLQNVSGKDSRFVFRVGEQKFLVTVQEVGRG